jgi:thioredoxin reductase
MQDVYDVIVAGGGAGGLTAALVRGRVRRRTLVCDSGTYRNAGVPAVNGLFALDGSDPAAVREQARRQLERYSSVEVRDVRILSARRDGTRFRVRLADGTECATSMLLLATGVTDELPPIPGLAPLWGRGAYSCPFCDGWENRDRPLAVLGGVGAPLLALQLRTLSERVVLCTDGRLDLSDTDRQALDASKVTVNEEPIAGVVGDEGGGLRAVEFADGSSMECAAAFLHPPTRQASDLPAQLGCEMLEDGSVAVQDFGPTSVAGVFAVGDMARRREVPVAAAAVVLAAAEGAAAAAAMHSALLMRDLGMQLPLL